MQPIDARAVEQAMEQTHKQIAAVAHFHPERERCGAAILGMDGEGLSDSVTGESLHEPTSAHHEIAIEAPTVRRAWKRPN